MTVGGSSLGQTTLTSYDHRKDMTDERDQNTNVPDLHDIASMIEQAIARARRAKQMKPRKGTRVWLEIVEDMEGLFSIRGTMVGFKETVRFDMMTQPSGSDERPTTRLFGSRIEALLAARADVLTTVKVFDLVSYS